MSSREERVKVFEDTMKWCQDDDYLIFGINILLIVILYSLTQMITRLLSPLQVYPVICMRVL